MPRNRATWLAGPKVHPFLIDDAPFPEAGPGEVVIRAVFTALNPAEWKIQDLGIIVTKYPNILGADAAGFVEQVGQGVTHVKPGQRVIAYNPFLSLTQTSHSLLDRYCTGLGRQDPAFGTFQLYSKADANLTSLVPEKMTLEEAAVLPLTISTASVGLFKKKYLGLPLPKADLETGKEKGTLLVWGGSSSVGGTAVQLASAAGLRVVATASRGNFERVRELGAEGVVDYHDGDVVQQILHALEGDVVGVYDAVSTEASLKPIGEVLERIGERKVVTVLPDENKFGRNAVLEFAAAFEITEDTAEVGDPIWREFVPKALESGRLLARPEPIVVGTGLEVIQGGLDRLKEGVSARKLVVRY
ncbi:hypothetical protein CMUS01_08676 [Colletotrichum musicola]|uniref:Enoyl reductase (ER) domain-containing protein n=1 Tax=Colletotrichum musicola TaxID=2175873 RepID=A0A8H6KAQ6_9PEZI|nr:hypothetical protein CMUS01_08676 [Colletotrichum musicola]